MCDPAHVNEIARQNKRTTTEDADMEEAEERMIAYGVKEYEAHLLNSFLDGNDIYPTTLVNAPAINDARMVRRDKIIITARTTTTKNRQWDWCNFRSWNLK